MRLPSENGQSAKKWRKTMKKGFFKKGTALAISAAMAVSMLPTFNPIEKLMLRLPQKVQRRSPVSE